MADGSLKFDTKIDDTGYVEGIQKMSSGQIKLQNNIKKTQTEMNKLEKSMKDMQDTKVPTQEYLDISKQISQAESQLNRYLAAEERLRAIGGVKSNSRSWKNLQYNINEARNTLNAAKVDMASLKASGGDYAVGTDTTKLELMQNKYSGLQDKMSEYNAKLADVKAKEESTVTSTSRLSVVFKKLQTACSIAIITLKKVGTMVKTIGSSFGSIINGVGKATSAVVRGAKTMLKRLNPLNGIKKIFSGMLGRMLLMSIGFMALSKGLRALGNGFSSIVHTSPKLSANLSQIKGNLYTAFQPILETCIPALNTLFSMLVKVTSALAQFINMLFGKSISASQAAAQAQYNQAKALDKTAGSADKTKKALGGLADFDELHTVGGEKDSSKDAGDNTIKPDFTTEIKETEGVSSFATALKKAWGEADFTEIGTIIGKKLNSALMSIPWENIQLACNGIAKKIVTFINGFMGVKELWDSIGQTMGKGINTAIGFLNTAVNTLNWKNIGDSLGLAIQSLFNTVDWDVLSNTLSTGINGVFSGLSSMIARIDFAGIGKTLAECLNKLISDIDWKGIGKTLSDGINSAIGTLYTFVTKFDWKELGKAIGEGINNFIRKTNWKKGIFSLVELARGLLDGIVNAVKKINWKELGKTFVDCIAGVNWKGVARSISGAIKTALSALFDFFVGIGSSIFEKIASGISKSKATKHFKNVVSAIKDVFDGIADWFKTTFTTAWTNVKKVFSTGGKIFTGIKDGILEGLKFIINDLIGGINKVISVPFNGINSALRIIKGINILGAKPFSFIQEIDVPQIPKLANGTVVPANYGNFLSILGDNKRAPEVVSPIPTMKQAFKEALNEMGNNNNNSNIHMHVYLDGKEIHREVVKQDKIYTNQTGKSAFVY